MVSFRKSTQTVFVFAAFLFRIFRMTLFKSSFLFGIFLMRLTVAFGSLNLASNLTPMGEWKKTLIEKTGCQFISEDQLLVRNVCLMPYYQSNESPYGFNDTHILSVNLQTAKVLDIDEANDKLTVHVSQHLFWFDHRIRANFMELPKNISIIKLSPDNIFKIWHPELDLYTLNLLNWRSLYEPNLYKDIVVQEDENKTKEYPELIAWKDWRATIHCEFDFTSFPFDTQICNFIQTIDSNSMTKLEYFSELTNDKYTAVGFEIEITVDEKYYENDTYSSSATKKEIGFNITLRRIVSPYLYQCYLPCAAIVAVSQVSFMIPSESIPGRISLIATQFLTLTNIFIYQLSHSPSGTQLNALEIYTIVSLFFVLVTLFEYGIVLVLKRTHLLEGKGNDVENFEIQNNTSPVKVSEGNEAKTLKTLFNAYQNQRNASYHKEKRYSRSDKIDVVSFVIFTFAYIAFNCFYTAKYTN